MPLDFEAAYREAVASAQTSITFRDTVTISHSTFPSIFRFVRADVDLTLDGDLYLGRQFTVTLPEMKANSSGNLDISIADIARAIGDVLDAAVITLEPIAVLFKSFLSTETAAQAQFTAPLEGRTISISGRTLLLSATYPDLIKKKVPGVRYTTNIFPGLR